MKTIRYGLIALVITAGALITLLSAAGPQAAAGYPNAELLATPGWLQQQLSARPDSLVVVDVRADKYLDGEFIPGATRLPWRTLRKNAPSRQLAGIFVGVDKAQAILGQHGIARNDEIVLYDSVERDGGATASYVFWVLDMLGHEKKRILNGGLDAWKAAGNATSSEPAEREAVLYQAPLAEIRLDRKVDGDFIQKRLGDPYYQILDARSPGEYSGEKPNTGMDGRILKLGHVPSAYNQSYTNNWQDQETKKIKSFAELQALYPGLDPQRAVITYCHSARRGSFAYFILRLMGFADVRLYDHSWFEWGNQSLFYPVEQKENIMAGPLPGTGASATQPDSYPETSAADQSKGKAAKSQADDGYVSCGG